MVSMNRRLRITLAALGAVTFFIFLLGVFTSLAAAFIGAGIGFCLIWLLAGFLHWLYTKRFYYIRKNQEYINKQTPELGNDKLQEGGKQGDIVGGTNKNGNKPAICDFALFAFLIPILYLIASSLMICAITQKLNIPTPFGFFLTLCGMVVMFYLFVLPASFISGFIAIIRIVRSKRLLKGYTFSILGILLSVWAFDLSGAALHSPRMYSAERICQSNMKQLGNMIKDYSQLHNGQYPAPNKWGDLLLALWKSENQLKIKGIIANREKISNDELDELLIFEARFFCPGHSGRYGKRSSYAINPNCRPDSLPDTVLLFETDLEDWNEYGGPECVSFNHPIISVIPFRRVKGCNVLFNDGHAELISSKKIGMLRWKDEREK
jgi:prepilin-type processing-associated H-X9-DG protein